MMKRRLPAILLAMATLSCAAHGAAGTGTPPEISIGQDAAGSTLALRLGQRLTISLPANPTTGYVWEQSSGAEAILARRGEPQFSPESAKLGAGGTYRFAFQALAPGSVHVKFILRRAFDKTAAPAETFEVTVTVEKGEAG